MTDLREAEAREEAWHLWRVGHLGGFPREAFAAGFDAGRATEAARYRGRLEALRRAQSVIKHGAEMVGPDVYEFTKDEVIDVAAEAIDAALAENPAPAARYRDEAMVERAVEMFDFTLMAQHKRLVPRNEIETAMRAALAVIAEPFERDSTDLG